MKLPNKKALKENKFSNWILKQTNSNWFAQLVGSIIIWGIALIPIYIYFGIRWLIGPADFWQEFAILLVCAIVMGWPQLVLLFIAVILTLMLLFDEF